MDAKIKNLNFLPAPTGGKVTVALTGDRNQVSVTVPGSLSEVEAHKAFRLDRSRHTATVEAMTELAGGEDEGRKHGGEGGVWRPIGLAESPEGAGR